MTPEEKKEVKLEIESRIKEAEENLVTLREQTAPIPPSVALGRLTRMDQIQQKSMAEANVKTNENLVKNLNKA
ncbi:MAG: hypothetical protein GY754_07780, partial [bacterium]|nr:hypothetical protein [bacterium]